MSVSAGRRLSPLRILVVLAIVAGLAGVGWLGWQRADRAVERITSDAGETWFAPYVDVTLIPSHAFEDPLVSPSPLAVLGFVVPDRRDPCTPTWGTQYDLDGAASELDLDRRIARLRERGGDVVISFGGVVNSELAVACRDEGALTDAYRSVLDRYGASMVDLDVEAAALDDAAANDRRAVAFRTLQRDPPSGRPLQVWLTLPVTPDGLPPAALGVVDAMLQARVQLAGVNVMAMDYGASRPAGMGMAEAARQALTATHDQLAAAYRRAGVAIGGQELWSRVGATAMIGRNDVEGEVFTLGDAASLAGFAEGVGLGRLSIWSANRDDRCAPQDDGGWRVLPTCSGIDQDRLAFTNRLLGRLRGSPTGEAAPTEAASGAAGRVGDDPQASPYPIWRADRTYREGEKVVWQRTVYVAKWWTSGDAPDAPVAHDWDSPWRDIGPVLPGDARTVSPDGARPPRWTGDVVYPRGDRVRHDGFLYEARWRTQGDEPQLDPDLPAAAAWTVVGLAVGDLPPVFDHPAGWRPDASYVRGDRVSVGVYVYEARRASRGIRPKPVSEQPDRAAWKVIGTRTDLGRSAEG